MTEGQAVSPEPDKLPQPGPINPRRPWYRKLGWQIIIVMVVTILTAAVLSWSPWSTVRVTDGSDPLADNLREVQGLILDENKRVISSGRPWVSIAVMLPIRTTDEARNKPEDALRHIQGAYLAQYWSNHPNGDDKFGDNAPLIRILIADTGYEGLEWRDTVAQLGEMAKPDNNERLVAVAGLGLSTDATQQAPSSRGESHPPALTDPYVTISRHTALVVLVTRPEGRR